MKYIVLLFTVTLPDVSLANVQPQILHAAISNLGSNHQIAKFDLQGSSVDSFPLPELPQFIAVDQAGRIFTANLNSRFIRWFSDSGEPLPPIGFFSDISSAGHPAGMTFDDQGLLYVGTNARSDFVERFATTPSKLGVFATLPPPRGDFVAAPFAISFDSEGRLYVPNGIDVLRFDPSGAPLGVFATLPPSLVLSYVADIALDSLGNLYVLEKTEQAGHFGHVYNSQGQRTDSFILMNNTDSFAVDDNDTLYIGGDRAIWRLNAGGGLTVFASNLPGRVLDLEFFGVPEPCGTAMALLSAGALTFAGRARFLPSRRLRG